jgi:hypothetical protein
MCDKGTAENIATDVAWFFGCRAEPDQAGPTDDVCEATHLSDGTLPCTDLEPHPTVLYSCEAVLCLRKTNGCSLDIIRTPCSQSAE